MKELLENGGQILALLVSFCVLAGLFGKYVILPWLEDRFAPLAKKVNETHHQVTTNGHISDEPTLKDQVHSLQSEVRELKGETRRDLQDMRGDLRTAGRMMDLHLDWSSREAGELWAALIAIRDGLSEDETDGNNADNEGNKDE